jgi:hypothetical protein
MSKILSNERKIIFIIRTILIKKRKKEFIRYHNKKRKENTSME